MFRALKHSQMKYTIITENDESEWKDQTGETYHFPKRYLFQLEPGTKVIYYKGKMRNKAFADKRLTPNPYYFGIAEIGNITKDPNSYKEDYFAAIKNFISFPKPVLFKEGGNYLEEIPRERLSNYFRDGVRLTTQKVYDKIKSLAGFTENDQSVYNDNQIESPSLESEFFEGGQKKKYTTYYERDQRAREQAIIIHGFTCMACGLNFEERYGEWGKGFIHVHHTKPVSSLSEKSKINPRTDLVVLCANCHAMVHRRRDTVLTLDDLKNKMS